MDLHRIDRTEYEEIKHLAHYSGGTLSITGGTTTFEGGSRVFAGGEIWFDDTADFDRMVTTINDYGPREEGEGATAVLARADVEGVAEPKSNDVVVLMYIEYVEAGDAWINLGQDWNGGDVQGTADYPLWTEKFNETSPLSPVYGGTSTTRRTIDDWVVPTVPEVKSVPAGDFALPDLENLP